LLLTRFLLSFVRQISIRKPGNCGCPKHRATFGTRKYISFKFPLISQAFL